MLALPLGKRECAGQDERAKFRVAPHSARRLVRADRAGSINARLGVSSGGEAQLQWQERALTARSESA